MTTLSSGTRSPSPGSDRARSAPLLDLYATGYAVEALADRDEALLVLCAPA
jgi:hypothetical protein